MMKVFVKILGKAGMDRIEMTDPKITGITFVLDDGQEFAVVDYRGKLGVRTNNGTLVVEPEAANSVLLSESR